MFCPQLDYITHVWLKGIVCGIWWFVKAFLVLAFFTIWFNWIFDNVYLAAGFKASLTLSLWTGIYFGVNKCFDNLEAYEAERVRFELRHFGVHLDIFEPTPFVKKLKWKVDYLRLLVKYGEANIRTNQLIVRLREEIERDIRHQP